MKLAVYESIIADYRRLRQEHGINKMKFIIDLLLDLYKEKNIDRFTMFNLINYEYRKELKINCSSNEKNINLIADEWNEELSVMELAERHNVCAYALLRTILNRITQSKDVAKSWLKDSINCPDGKLAHEIMLLNIHDVMNGVFYNQLCLNAGITFELEIRSILEQNKISFKTEEELRASNYDVTPDFRFNIPMVLVRTSNSLILFQSDTTIPDSVDNEVDRCIITWLECKAVFASIECHLEYYENQYCSYINRFGDGIVLYKHGFVEDIASKYSHNLIITQQMPLISPVSEIWTLFHPSIFLKKNLYKS